MKKTLILFLIIASLVFPPLAIVGEDLEPILEPIYDKGERATHTVLGEYGTATWCGYCKYAHGALKSLYAGGTLDFNYVSFVADVNTHASNRLSQYNLYGYPTVFWDGGYDVDVGAGSQPGAEATYTTSITNAGNRAVYDIDISLTVQWLGNAAMNIGVVVTNNEPTTYNGFLRVYVTEISSSLGWIDTAGYPYTHAFLEYAFNENLGISSGGTYQDSILWDGHNYSNGYGTFYGNIVQDNVMVIGAVYNDTWHQGYAYPPSSNPFSAYYVDEVVSAVPTAGDTTPPTISNVQATPSSQVAGGLVNITATVTDNVAVDTVAVYITPPGGTTPTQYPMAPGSGDTYYYEASYSTLGTYNYYIYAQDTGGNEALSPTQSFTIYEANPPTITNIQATALMGDQVTITCDVQDDTSVDTVSINISDPLGDFTEAVMIPSGGDTYSYTGTFPILGGYGYTITADDTFGNSYTTNPYVLMRQMMHSGWNLITVPLENGWTAETLGGNITGCTVVDWLDCETGTHISHVVGSPHDDFPIENGVGYFIYVNTDSIFTATGENIQSVNVHIYQSWNVIGWYHGYSTNASDLGLAITDCAVVIMYDPVTGLFTTHVVGVPHDDFLVEQGMGLYIYTNSASDWYGEG